MNSSDRVPALRDFERTAREWLSASVAIDSLAIFRIWFGLMMMVEAFQFIRHGWISTTFVEPQFLFKYYFFEWVHPWPGNGMHLHFVALFLLAACVLTGLFYRVAIVLLAIGITYVFLLEKAIYLNHLYLICLVSWILVFIPCHRAWSLDALRHPKIRSSGIPLWCLWLMRFQIGVPYFFGGVAKLDRDWLSGDTVTMFFLDDTHRWLIGPYMISDAVITLVTWGGLLFDLSVVPLLLWKRTRISAYVVVVAFHLSNSVLFNIGIFPWMMIGATTIFFAPDWPRRLLLKPPQTATLSESVSQRRSLALPLFLVVWVTVQLFVPMRQFMYPGNPSWTDEGHNFCWRMMLRRKITQTKVMAIDNHTGERGRIAVERFLTPRQIRNMSRSPDLLLQFSHFLERTLHRDFGYDDVAIHVAVKASLNGRRAQLLVDPSVDLTTKERSLLPAEWILPLTAPTLRDMRNGQAFSAVH